MSKKGKAILSVKEMTLAAMFMAMSVAIAMFCKTYSPLTGALRITFENLPIIMAGIIFGPLVGGLIGGLTDPLTYLITPQALPPLPLITVGAAMIGITAGVVAKYIIRRHGNLQIIMSAASAHLLGSVIIKSIGLFPMFSWEVLLRIPIYAVIGTLEIMLICLLFKNRGFKKLILEIEAERQKLLRGIMQKKKEKNADFKGYANSFQAVTVPGLERIRGLLELLGNPHKGLKFIHVAGTNGKGSVCANLASILSEWGLKVGKYISPNLIKVNERISINGTDISDNDLATVLDEIEPHCKSVEASTGLSPTQFEIWTAAAFLYFKKMGCDIVVLEVGLGGELDATNVIERNELAIITRLGLDHTAYLGNTIEEIAAAKAGIIKEDCTFGKVITANQEPGALKVIEKKCKLLGLELSVPEPTPLGAIDINERFSLPPLGEIQCGIGGYHQIENASLAAEAARIMGVPQDCIKRGIIKAKNPARFELIAKNPTVIYDGGHNENGIDALVKSIKHYYGDVKKTVIFASMTDKEIGYSLSALNTPNTEFIFTTVSDNPRAESPEGLLARAEALGVSGVCTASIAEAYRLATVAEAKRDGIVLICGSLYLYKDLYEAVISKFEKE